MKRAAVCALAILMLDGCATIAPGLVDTYEVVDCELPGVVLHIGTTHATTGRSHALRTSADDCGLRGGYYTAADRANYETALRVWLTPAEEGDAQAQYFVGQIYEKGLGRPSDPGKAAQWYRRAADANLPAALTALAMLYERGVAGAGDARTALDLYRRAANLDEPLAFGRDLVAREHQIDSLKIELASTRTTAEQQSEDLQRRKHALELEVQGLRAELERARSAASAEQAERIQRALDEKQRSLQDEAANVANAAHALARVQHAEQRVDGGASSVAAIDAPLIELIEPAATTLRGLMTVRVAAGATHQQIRIRVRSASRVREVSVNSRVVTPDAQGLASVDLPLTGKTTPVEVVTVDVDSHRGSLPFLLTNEELLPIAGNAQAEGTARSYGNYYALVIGNARYTNWHALTTPHHDAESVASILREKYGFQTTVLLDITRAQTFRALAELRSKLTERDNLLVYYSGHGSWDPESHQGYWVPIDGEKDSVANFISSADVTDLIGVMRARQILVVADSCYSGVFVHSIADRMAATDDTQRETWLLQRAQIPSRKVMSSGDIREVMDGGRGEHSVFAAEFIAGLQRHLAQPFEAQELYDEIAPRVKAAADGYGERQEPQYGQLRFAGHVGGDFVFVPLARKDLVSSSPLEASRSRPREPVQWAGRR